MPRSANNDHIFEKGTIVFLKAELSKNALLSEENKQHDVDIEVKFEDMQLLVPRFLVYSADDIRKLQQDAEQQMKSWRKHNQESVNIVGNPQRLTSLRKQPARSSKQKPVDPWA